MEAEHDAVDDRAGAVPPVAPRVPSVRELHGEAVTDDYAWMRDSDQAPLRRHLAAERAYYDARRPAGLAATLTAEAAERLPRGAECSVPWPRAGFTYRTVIPAGSDNAQLLRGGGGETDERVLLDENLLAQATGFVEVGVREPSPDGSLLAWSADTSGAEIYGLHIRDLSSDEDLPEVIACSYPGVAWCTASEHLFYLVPDELNRPHQVWRHRVGTPASDDVLVYEEPDQRFELTLHAARSGELGIITAASRDTTEVLLIALERPLEDLVLVDPRRRGTEYRVDHARGAVARAGSLYLVTDEHEPEFGLMTAPLATPARGAWQPVDCSAIAPARDDTRLVECDVLAKHLVLTIRRRGEVLLAIADHAGANVREIASGLTAGTIRIEHADDYDADSVIIAEESLIEPTVWSRLDLETGVKQALTRQEVPGHDPARYTTERRWAPASDGTWIPVTIARRADTALNGGAPCLLYGYGSYESSIDPEFDRSLASLLDRGVVYAIAHIRGGGECGRQWWQQGRLRTKVTTFTDHLAVADWLAGASGPRLVDGTRIVSRGASAGGLLQGAVYSMRPGRWRAIVAEVPFVDCVNSMLDATIPLTVNEWDEWGDPREPGDYTYMMSYSPYENPPAGPRPPLLVTGAVHDSRVGVHEPAKWVARLRSTDTADSPVMFRAELGVGSHGGPSGRLAQLGYEAEVQAFVLDAVGIGE